jgi:hypothetical protein
VAANAVIVQASGASSISIMRSSHGNATVRNISPIVPAMTCASQRVCARSVSVPAAAAVIAIASPAPAAGGTRRGPRR